VSLKYGAEVAMTVDYPIDPISTRWKVIYVIGCMTFVGLFALFSQPGKGLVASFSFASIVLAARVRWDLRREHWFWLFWAVSVLVHSALVVAFNGSIGFRPTIVFAPLGIADFVLLLSCVFWLERVMKSRAREHLR
jgi:hypothetical protein